jgi:hypothetical protein
VRGRLRRRVTAATRSVGAAGTYDPLEKRRE